MLPLPRRVSLAIWLASRSIWNIKPLNFSTIQRPLESVSRSNTPAVVVPVLAPRTAVTLTVRITSRLISAKISVVKMFDNSVSASKPWIAFKSCASSIVYSAFKARDLAVTVTLSIVNAISGNALPPLSPKASAVAVDIPSAKLYPLAGKFNVLLEAPPTAVPV